MIPLTAACAHPPGLHMLRVAAGTALILAVLAAPAAAGERGHDDHGTPERGEEHSSPHPRRFTVDEFVAAGVRVATAGAGTVDAGIDLPGQVRANPDRIAHIAARFPGVVRTVRKQIGDQVSAGEVLAVIESNRLAPYDLKAAFAGTVVEKHIAPGELAGPDVPAFTVADLSTVWFEIAVHQKVLPHVRLGQAVTISAGGAVAEGTVSYLAPVLDLATRTAAARVVLPNPEGVWRPGMFVTAALHTPIAVPVVISRSALHTVAGDAVVFVASDGHFAPRHVTPGARGRTRVAIVSGLASGERYAEEGSFLVKAELAKDEAEHHH